MDENKIIINLPHYYQAIDVDDLNQSVPNKDWFVALEEEPVLGGGIVPFGIIIAIGSAIASGFLEGLGSDIYDNLKKKLFRLKEKKVEPDVFNVNVFIENRYGKTLISFDFTELGEEDFYKAFNVIDKTYIEHKELLTSDCAWYQGKYDPNAETWDISKLDL